MSRRCVVWDLFNFVVGRGGTEDEELTHSLATAPITAFVDRDPRQPSAQPSGTIIFPQMAERRNEAILGKVKRLFRIAYESADQPEYRGLMPVHDICACRLPVNETQRGKFTIGARQEIQTHRASSRSEERRVGKEGVRTGRSRWGQLH